MVHAGVRYHCRAQFPQKHSEIKIEIKKRSTWSRSSRITKNKDWAEECKCDVSAAIWSKCFFFFFWLNNNECQILQERNLQSPGNKSAEELNCSTFTTVDYLSLTKSVFSKPLPSMAQYIGRDKNIYKPQAYPPLWHHFLNWFVTSGFKGKLCNKQSYTGEAVIKLSIYKKTTIFIG